MSRRRERLRLRGRTLLADYRSLVIVVCLIIAGVGGLVAHTAYVDPGTETSERTVASWTTAGSFDHSATVTRENPLFRDGRILTDRRAYFQRITPVVDGTYQFEYAADGGNVSTRTEAMLVVESVDDDTVFWRRTTRLGQFSDSNVPPRRAVELPFSVNISRTAGLIDRVQETVGRSPGDVRVAVRTTTTYEGQIEGHQVQRSRTDEFVLASGEAAFQVDETTSGESQARVTTTETQLVRYGPLRRVGGPLALIVGLVVAGVVAALDPGQLTLSATEQQRLAFLRDRREYAEWISAIRPPAETNDFPTAEADTVADLVDFAIDSDNGVLFDWPNDRYCVIESGTLYVYQPPQPMNRRSLRSFFYRRLVQGKADESPTDESTNDGASAPRRSADGSDE